MSSPSFFKQQAKLLEEQELLQQQTRKAVSRTESSAKHIEYMMMGVIGIAIAYAGYTYYHIRTSYNTAACGHMISSIDAAHRKDPIGVPFTGWQVAAAYSVGVFRWMYFAGAGSEILPDVIVTLYFSVKMRGLLEQDTAGNLSRLRATATNNPGKGVQTIICQVFSQTPNCQKMLCHSGQQSSASKTQAGVNMATTLAMPMMMVAPEAAPVAAVAGYFLGRRLHKRENCDPAVCKC